MRHMNVTYVYGPNIARTSIPSRVLFEFCCWCPFKCLIPDASRPLTCDGDSSSTSVLIVVVAVLFKVFFRLADCHHSTPCSWSESGGNSHSQFGKWVLCKYYSRCHLLEVTAVCHRLDMIELYGSQSGSEKVVGLSYISAARQMAV